jgi:hypothetical protein
VDTIAVLGAALVPPRATTTQRCPEALAELGMQVFCVRLDTSSQAI